jgi:hypothetical protein
VIRKWTGPVAAALLATSTPALATQAPDNPLIQRPAAVPMGRYACYASGSVFDDLIILGPQRYSDSGGETGAFTYVRKEGVLTFTSGPFAGAYARMTDANLIRMSDRGSPRLGYRCVREK